MDTLSIDTAYLENELDVERAKEESHLKALSKKVSYLHPSVLFYKESSKLGEACKDARYSFASNVTTVCSDLGLSLGIQQGVLDTFKNNGHYFPADLLLQYYGYTSEDCLDTVLNHLIKMKQFSILREIEEPFTRLAQCFNASDSGYQSRSLAKKKCFMKSLIKELAPMLERHLPHKIIESEDELDKPHPADLRTSVLNETLKPEDHEFIFLTCTKDGLNTALKIKEYVKNWTEYKVTALTLSDICSVDGRTPEQCVREYFSKAIFMVPIVTSGYLQEINKTNSENTNLDHKYARYIYNLITSSSIHTSINKNVRSVLPADASMEVHRSIAFYPELLPWTHEDNFDVQFKAFIDIL